MSKTRIEWTDETWNPVTGCTPESVGCQNCYARRMAQRMKGRYGYPADDPFRVTFHPEKLDYPDGLKKPSRIFVCSMGDLFHWDVQPDWIRQIFEVIRRNTRHNFVILTKRPHTIHQKLEGIQIPENLMMGISAETVALFEQRSYFLHDRNKTLFDTMKTVVSFEPFLDSYKPLETEQLKSIDDWLPRYSWVIIGGETGAGARPMESGFILTRYIRKVALNHGIPFFFKKAGKDKTGKPRETPEDLQVREFPKR